MSKWRSLNQLHACEDASSGLPAGFFRLRYFHGKEMRLADYIDEQRYHAGKLRFHNEKLHGAGILCGLKVTALEPEGTLLRVGRGAAIDDCGREIVVGFDQCIDVAAWFRTQAYEFEGQDHNPCEPDPDNRVKICVMMRYSECVGAPEPAPPSHCAPPDACECGRSAVHTCDPACGEGAQFGRVTEEFELRLMFWDDARRVSEHDLFPTRDRIDATIAGSAGGIGLLSALAGSVRERCPGTEEGWLLLACFYVRVEAQDPAKVTRIEEIDYSCASQVLLSSETIQYLLTSLYAEVDPDIGGPEIENIGMRQLADGRYQIFLELSGPIEPKSLEAEGSFALRSFTANGWQSPAGNALVASYAEAIGGDFHLAGPAIYIAVDNANGFLAEHVRYQLYAPESVDPVVDDKLRRLRPRHLSWRFTLATDPGTGILDMQPLGT